MFCENRNIEVLRQCVADALGEDPFRDYKQLARELLHGDAGEPSPPSVNACFPMSTAYGF
ncbi:hypothetical protein HSBAA_57250 [Vreelandella sulfidaeris]|uniref:Uncharacterized protein n=1 Tax=Vreelandella sulfidaeris TaxID=115553 RepID=A0A455UJK5_9GAMM|nr:hypothetical protein HSBAA_57250 [Halomonas sulfidaeris]